ARLPKGKRIILDVKSPIGVISAGLDEELVVLERTPIFPHFSRLIGDYHNHHGLNDIKCLEAIISAALSGCLGVGSSWLDGKARRA
ncbi:hypothetical protein HDU93_001400, partial [Gonapodya sp. JEL0774]